MDIAEPLLAAHRARFAAVDALLPPAAPPAEGRRLDAATADGTRVTGVLQRHRLGPGDVPMLWSAADVWQLFPYIGDTGTEGADLLLRRLKDVLAEEAAGDDSACLVVWPSRDAEAIRAFLDHGLVPLGALGVRTAAPAEADPGVTVRRAGPADFAAALELATATFDYTGLVAAARRVNTAELLAPSLRDALAEEEPAVWLAEEDGELRALAHCAWVDATETNAAGELLPAGRWGYVNNVVTAAGRRGGGLGRALMARVHRELHAGGATRTYLYYNPTNPLSSVFWHRQGYRPLWTSWEVRPASALR
ncbi:GNAT family N-acetyltransferase [Amycolatopsis australiensis]|uniref:Acetyltransferase (GNAT) domain-containing protein n=1 Tax=Amycolatopsis australiensis TaxID=546364 RepID=A0A1K1SVC7_9PSEU|nr:GNAT family N-acetyltransferase [Amycolatopsis australiensis]SFW88246.1 Acetyltransferase (GNAT) domain-containing protein [Amycolatopsis australiensis]